MSFFITNSSILLSKGNPYQLDAIKEAFEKTGKCTSQLAKEAFLGVNVCMALPKNSPYTKTINKG